MDEYKIKLINLNLILPNHEPNSPVYDLSLYIINYLRDEHDPIGFIEATCQSLEDLYLGYNNFTGKEISDPLTGFHKAFYQKLLKEEMVEITTAIFPEDFAGEIKNYIKKLLDEK